VLESTFLVSGWSSLGLLTSPRYPRGHHVPCAGRAPRRQSSCSTPQAACPTRTCRRTTGRFAASATTFRLCSWGQRCVLHLLEGFLFGDALSFVHSKPCRDNSGPPTSLLSPCLSWCRLKVFALSLQVDYRDRKVKPKAIMFHRKKNLRYYDVSATANYQVIEPLSWLLAKTTGDGDLKIDEVSRSYNCFTLPGDSAIVAAAN